MSEISKQALKVDNSTSFPNNNTGYISPAILRDFNINMIDSLVEQESYNADSASWNNSISELSAFTASQQPSFDALNVFTASTAVSITAINAFTQSAQANLNTLNGWTGSWNAWTSSINEIRDDGILQGYSTRLYFNGLVSASIVPNVNGPIANITIQQDGTKLDSASFNSYTASASASQATYSSSVSSSFGNVYTTIAGLSVKTGSYATTSSNTFDGNQIINADLTVNGNITATSIHTIIESASIIYSSGSNILGDNPNEDRQILNGQTEVSGNVYVSGSINLHTSGADGHAFSGKALFLTNSVQTGITVESPIHFYQVGKGNFYLQNNVNGVGSGSINITAANNAPLNISASAINVNKGDINIPSNNVIVGANPTSVYNGLGLINGPGNYALINYGNTSAIFNLGAVDANSFAYSTEILATATPTQITLQDFSFGSYQYETWLTLLANNGSNPKPFFNRGIRTSGSIEYTGSAYGNVVAVPTVSSTASIDLSKGNYFTLTMGGTTKINVINPQPGVTATLVINTDTLATASFSANVKQPSGSLYVASPSGNVDIISFTAVNSNTVYAFPAQTFI